MSLFIDIKKGLSSFNLDVSMKSKGGIIGFLGASGSGKSTLAGGRLGVNELL